MQTITGIIDGIVHHIRQKFQFTIFECRIGLRIVFVSLLVGITTLLMFGIAINSQAQTNATPWSDPVNISASGAASQPVIGIAGDNTIHALWWDAVDGEMYAHTASITDTRFIPPIAIAQIIGEKLVDVTTGKLLIFQPPHGVRLQASANGHMIAFWLNTTNQLQSAQITNDRIGAVSQLAIAASALDAYTDISGTIHLAYARTNNLAGNPSGLYYRQTTAIGWSDPKLIYPSTYFRTVTSKNLNLNMAGDNSGRIIVAWEDTQLGASFAHSMDSGATWSAPQVVTGTQDGRISQLAVGRSPNGEFLMLWRDPTAVGCGFTQRRSSDGGSTWGELELVFADMTHCPAGFALKTGGDGRLWLVAMPVVADSDPPGTNALAQTSSLLAAWDGKLWSQSIDVTLTKPNSSTGKSDTLGCLSFASGGPLIAFIGCDPNADIWVAQNTLPLDQLLARIKPSWSAFEILSQNDAASTQSGIVTPNDLPALTADENGNLYALWSQAAGIYGPDIALYGAAWLNRRWSHSNPVISSPEITGSITSQNIKVAPLTEQPAIAADGHGRLHAVWSGGANGQIYYSKALVRDATFTQGWTKPVALPAPSSAGAWPQIIADQRGQMLYVVFAVPYNEKRGIWFVRSDDSGESWSKPVMIFDAAAADWSGAGEPSLALDPAADVLHVVWLRSALPGDVNPQVIDYSRSNDRGATWNAPLLVTVGFVESPQVVVMAPNQVYLLWQSIRTRSQSGATAPYELWGQSSPSAGARWGEPAPVPGFEEVSGRAGLVSDGTGRIYLAAIGKGTGSLSELKYAQWDGQHWSAVERFGLDQPSTLGNSAVAAITNRTESSGVLQVVLRTWRFQSDGSGQFEILSTSHFVTAATPLQPAPTFTPLPTATPTATPTPLPTATPRPQIVAQNAPPAAFTSPFSGQEPLLIGGIVALLVIAGLVLVAARSRQPL